MGFTEAIKTCLKKSFSIKGCASRSEYWWFVAFQYLGAITLILLMAIIVQDDKEGIAIPALIFMLLLIPARFCATIRRLHDQNKSGWYFLIVFIPYIGSIILFIMMLISSDPDSRFRTQEEKENMNMPKL